MTGRSTAPKQVVKSEDFTQELEELLSLARTGGRALRVERLGEAADDRSGDPATAAILGDEVRELLEREVVPAFPENGLLHGELEREIQKKALIGLHLDTLRRLAETLRVDSRGGLESLAQRIARAYRYDDAEIAKLVVEHTEDPIESTSHQSRLFFVEEGVDLDRAAQRLNQMAGRLVRTGVARWLQLRSADRTDDRLEISGQLRAYRVDINETDEGPALHSHVKPKPVEFELRDNSPVLLSQSAGAALSKVAARGIAAIMQNELLETLPLDWVATGVSGTFDKRTLVLLDLVYFRLAELGVTRHNLVVARFMTERGDQPAQPAPEEATEHALKAVRFEGDHVLESPQACQFIAKQHRGLVDVSLRVAVPGIAGEDHKLPWFPVRITLEREQLGVMTGFGRYNAEASLELHQGVVQQAQEALTAGPRNQAGLENLASQIVAVAESGEPAHLQG